MAEDSFSLLEVLHDRYGDDEPLQINILVSKNAPGKTDSGQLILPKQLGLNKQKIKYVGDAQEISSLCGAITEIDLADNLISDWSEVFMVLRCLPKLKFLNLSHNPVCKCSSLCDISPPSIDNDLLLTRLVLNGLQIPWQDVWQLLKLVPKVQEIHLCLNNFNSVDPPPQGTVFPNIKHIYLNGNLIKDWADLEKIGQALPNLENLVLIDNPIETLCQAVDTVTQAFPCVQNLNLTQTKINCWDDVESLRYWSKLTDLRIQELPVLEPYKEMLRRQLTISYLPNITRLNGSPVTEAEKEDAERAFIRHYMDQSNHPNRYTELHTVYGDLEPLAEVTMTPETSVTVTIRYQGKNTLQTLDVNWTLKQVKQKIRQLVNPPSDKLTVYHKDVGGPPQGSDPMRYNTRTLIGYRVKDGDELHVF